MTASNRYWSKSLSTPITGAALFSAFYGRTEPVGASEFSHGPGLVAPELADKPPSEGGRYRPRGASETLTDSKIELRKGWRGKPAGRSWPTSERQPNGEQEAGRSQPHPPQIGHYLADLRAEKPPFICGFQLWGDWDLNPGPTDYESAALTD
jgi:hypothetical protein